MEPAHDGTQKDGRSPGCDNFLVPKVSVSANVSSATSGVGQRRSDGRVYESIQVNCETCQALDVVFHQGSGPG